MATGKSPEDDWGTSEPPSAEPDSEDELTWSISDGQFEPVPFLRDNLDLDRIANSTADYAENIKTRIQVFLAMKLAFELSGSDIAAGTETAGEIRTYVLDAADFCIDFFAQEYKHSEEDLIDLTPELDEQPPPLMRALEAVLEADRSRQDRDKFRAGLWAEWGYRPPQVSPIKGDARRFSRAIIRVRSLEEKGLSREEIVEGLKALAKFKQENAQ